MKYVYIHGYGSSPNLQNAKVVALATIGHACVVGYDSNDTAHNIESTLADKINALYDIEMIIAGTSLGGYWAARMAEKFNSRFVAINPCLNPTKSLAKYEAIPQTSLDSYTTVFAENNQCSGLILLDSEDEILDSYSTKNRYEDRYPIVMFDGGNHRFAHINESLTHIQHLANGSLLHQKQ